MKNKQTTKKLRRKAIKLQNQAQPKKLSMAEAIKKAEQSDD